MKNKICSIKDCRDKIYAKEWCCKHYMRQRRYGSSRKPKLKRDILLDAGKSFCPKCNEEKLLSNFCRDKHTYTGFAIYCKQCNSKKAKKRYRKHKSEHKNAQLKNDFGITLKQYKKMVNSQNNVCAICRKLEKIKNKSLSVDHCHKTGRIRGLLCSRCNTGLGLFQDSTDNLKQAIVYLKKIKE